MNNTTENHGGIIDEKAAFLYFAHCFAYDGLLPRELGTAGVRRTGGDNACGNAGTNSGAGGMGVAV